MKRFHDRVPLEAPAGGTRLCLAPFGILAARAASVLESMPERP